MEKCLQAVIIIIEAAERFTADPFLKILEDCGRILTDFGRASGGFRQDLGGSGRISAGLRQEVGWIRRSRADFGGKIADSRGDLVVCPGAASVANLALARCCLGGELRKARGPYLTSYQK